MQSHNRIAVHRVKAHRVKARRAPRPSAQDISLKFGLVLLIALIFTAADAFSASGVSPKFDGTYEGAMTPASDSNPQTCAPVAIGAFVVKDGYIRPPAKTAEAGPAVFDGFVTEEGFVSGNVRLSDGTRNQFEGRMVADAGGVLLSAGITDTGTGCAYLVELQKIG